MAKCAYCGNRKGKRPCPALDGSICTLCCGEHRTIEISCPSDCRYLGGGVRGRATRESLHEAGARLESISTADQEWIVATRDAFLGPDALDDWEAGCFVGYVHYGHRDAEGRTLVDRVLADRAIRLQPNERAAMEALREAWFSLFEVVRVELDQGLELRDLLTGEAVWVRERSATHHLKRLGLMLGWIVELEPHHELTGASASVPRPHRKAVLEAMTAAIEGARREYPEASPRALARLAVLPAHWALRDAFRGVQVPQLVNFEGEEILLGKAVFDVTDPDQARTRLAAAEDLEGPDERGRFRWLLLEEERPQGGPPGETVRGWMDLSPDGARLIFETNSRERLERGKQLLGRLLEGIARHRIDELSDLRSLVERDLEEGREVPRDSEIPPEVEAELLEKFHVEHLDRWIEMELPALGGLTPREAARSPGRRCTSP